MRKQQFGKPKYLSPAGLAKLQRCSERTIREWCKQDVIPEASRTRGGHYRISMPLSAQTRFALEKRSRNWPFKNSGGDLQGDFEPDLAEWLTLALIYGRQISKSV